MICFYQYLISVFFRKYQAGNKIWLSCQAIFNKIMAAISPKIKVIGEASMPNSPPVIHVGFDNSALINPGNSIPVRASQTR